MELFKKDLSSKIETVEKELVVKKGEQGALSKVVTVLVDGAKKCVSEANKSTSVDERIGILVGGLQEVVRFVETEAENATKDLLALENKIVVLKEVLQLANKTVEEEKKMADPKQAEKV